MQEDHKHRLLNRLKTVEGHIRGVQRMVEDDAYCIDIMQQVRAIQQALHRVNGIILENHLNTCVTKAIRSDQAEERERVLQELLQVFHATNTGKGKPFSDMSTDNTHLQHIDNQAQATATPDRQRACDCQTTNITTLT
jgi:DNA-binding FrmR family transcriptional regulator